MKKILLMTFLLSIVSTSALAELIHPGVSHNIADLERMKAMVQKGEEPWASEFAQLSASSLASCNYQVNGNGGTELINQGPFQNDSYAAYYNSLVWFITGDECHAQKSVEIFNSWKNLTRVTDTFALTNGRGIWKMMEGAEIIRYTYGGWAQQDIQDFEDMLVYPGWSGTTVPTAAIASRDVSFYWNLYQGDPNRYGNQGLFGFRSLMAMGVFLDNEIIYERALRYIQGQGHRADDLPYPAGPPAANNNTPYNDCEFIEERNGNGFLDRIEDYGYNEVLEHYIYENGQSQEAGRDQAHAGVGVQILASMGEIAWTQGDDLYGYLDNRVLKGMEYFMRYNVGAPQHSAYGYPVWNPTVASGEFIERRDRSGRFLTKQINPFVVCNTTSGFTWGNHILRPWYEMALGHYRDRMQLPESNYPWLLEGQNIFQNEIGFENESNRSEYHGWGGLKFHRVSPGDPISGFDRNGLPIFKMNVLPMTIEAENFDYFVTSGEDRTYNDTNTGNNGGAYRTDENVDIEVSSEGGFNVSSIRDGEYLTYTVSVPETGSYRIEARVASPNSTGTIQFAFDGVNSTGNISVPNTGAWQTYQTLIVANNVSLLEGVQQMRVNFPAGGFNLNSISITSDSTPTTSTTTPVAGKTYYIDNVRWNVRLAANGDEDPFTTSTNATGSNVEWTVTESPVSGFFFLDNNGGGASPRIRTDRTQFADMQASSSTGNQARWQFTNVGNDVFLLTTDYTALDFERLRINNSLQVETVADTSTGDWAQFTFTEVTPPSTVVQITKRNAQGFAIDGNNGAANGQSIYLYEQNSNNINQQWIEINRGGGFYSYQKQGTDHCIDGGNGGADRQDIYLWVCGENNRNQHWQKVSTDSGFFQLVKRNAPGFAINGGSGGANTQNVNLFNSSNTSQNLQWSIE